MKPESAHSHPEKNPEILVLGPRVEPEEDDEKKKKNEPISWHEMLFTLPEVSFATFFRKWMEVTDRYAEACSIFFGLRYGPPAYIDMTFLGMAQCLHLYYSRTTEGKAHQSNEEKQFSQIRSLLQPAEVSWLVGHLGDRPYPTFEAELSALLAHHRAVMNPLISNRGDRFVTEVMNTLYYLVHRETDTDALSSHGAELYWLLEKMRILFKASLLAELGFSEQQVVSWFEKSPLYQHMRELENKRESESVAQLAAQG